MLKIYTDGGAHNKADKSGIGGWAFVVYKQGKVAHQGSGAVRWVSSNQMELRALIEALRWASDNGHKMVTIYSDSKYTVQGANDWVKGWSNKDWTTYSGTPVKNVMEWKEILRLKRKFMLVTLVWVRGHSGVEGNELADSLCTEEIAKMKREHGSSSRTSKRAGRSKEAQSCPIE